jgi:hypothetical protein
MQILHLVTHLGFATSRDNRVTEHERFTHALVLAHGYVTKRNTLLLIKLTEPNLMQSYWVGQVTIHNDRLRFLE